MNWSSNAVLTVAMGPTISFCNSSRFICSLLFTIDAGSFPGVELRYYLPVLLTERRPNHGIA